MAGSSDLCHRAGISGTTRGNCKFSTDRCSTLSLWLRGTWSRDGQARPADLEFRNYAPAGDEWSFEVEFPDARLLHESLVAERGYERWDSDVFVARPEIFVGRIEGTIRQRGEPGGYPVLELSDTRMKLTRRDNSPGPGGSPVVWIELRLNGETMEVVLDSAKHDGSKFPCPSEGATPKKLAIRFSVLRKRPSGARDCR